MKEIRKVRKRRRKKGTFFIFSFGLYACMCESVFWCAGLSLFPPSFFLARFLLLSLIHIEAASPLQSSSSSSSKAADFAFIFPSFFSFSFFSNGFQFCSLLFSLPLYFLFSSIFKTAASSDNGQGQGS